MSEFLVSIPTKVPSEVRPDIEKALQQAVEQYSRQYKVYISVKDETYNGWRNWETWNVNLWLNNDQGTYNTCLEMAREATQEDAENANNNLATNLKDLVYDLMHPSDQVPSEIITDDISTHRVDWYEIADAFLEDIKESA